jgi:hypothetical protein
MAMRKWLLRALFIAACAGLALHAWGAWSGALPQYKNEVFLFSNILLYVLAFPGSFLVQLLHMGVQHVTPAVGQFDADNAFLGWMLMVWMPLTVVGYLQWFVLVPRLVRCWRGCDL